MAADKGLCGGLNSNIIKKANNFIAAKLENNIEVEVVQWGKRAAVIAKKLNLTVNETREKVLEKPDYAVAAAAAAEAEAAEARTKIVRAARGLKRRVAFGV